MQFFVAMRLVLDTSVWLAFLLARSFSLFRTMVAGSPAFLVIANSVELLLWAYFLFGLYLALRHSSNRVAPFTTGVLWVLMSIKMLSLVERIFMFLFRWILPQTVIPLTGQNMFQVFYFGQYVWSLAFTITVIRLANVVNRRFEDRLIGPRHRLTLIVFCYLVWLFGSITVALAEWWGASGGAGTIPPLWLLYFFQLYRWGNPAVTFLLLGWIWFALNLARMRLLTENRCAACDYDLTGNVSGSCPECGHSLQKPDTSTPLSQPDIQPPQE